MTTATFTADPALLIKADFTEQHPVRRELSEAVSRLISTDISRGVPIPALYVGAEALIPVTKNRRVTAFALCDLADAGELERYRWQLIDRRAKGWASYAVRVEGERGERTIPMHRQVLGLTRSDRRVVDHINHNGLDNRRANLRAGTRAENMQNRKGAQARNKTGYRGVRSMRGRFTAQVAMGGRLYLNGTYDTAIEAAVAACRWRAEHMPYSTHCGLLDCKEGVDRAGAYASPHFTTVHDGLGFIARPPQTGRNTSTSEREVVASRVQGGKQG